MKNIINREDIIHELTDLLISFAQDCNSYQTDVYIYYDADTETAKLSTFVNVGGNSWLDDDHEVLFVDHEHYENFWELYTEVSEIADVLNLNEYDLVSMVADHMGVDTEDVEWFNVRDYCREIPEYAEMVKNAYDDYIVDETYEYASQAEDILDHWESEADI